MTETWTFYNPVFEMNLISPLFESESAWRGHVRFGYDLVANTRPPLVVELGTHYGSSFFSFCQAAKDLSLKGTQLHAVDTWEGDAHSGHYDENVFSMVSRVAERFPHALLNRNTFDDASLQYPDGSIDILHVDGLHTYEAVRHDCEVWMPKLAPGGLLLIHDTEMRIGDFGVWQWWQELSARCPSFSFGHSAGLGVAAPNGSGPVMEMLLASYPLLREHYSR
ncbi:class I SAM-dependent methyltransferase [Paenibacillus herberti]|nr:class I SAM-dependent methyltransferase [Paenibacillus herberti]